MGPRIIRFALLLSLWIGSPITVLGQNFNLTAAVLVNSSNKAAFNTDPVNPGEFQCYAERYLENFQIPYELLDVSTTTPPVDLNSRQLIIAGHPGLTLPAAWQTAITAAVNGGTGFVNLDSDPAIGTGAHIQAIFHATSSLAGTPGSSITVPLAVTAGGATPHFIAGLQMKTLEPAGDFIYSFHADQNGALNTVTATVLQSAQGAVIAKLGNDPLILATTFGAGRAVNFGTLDYLQADRFGFLMGVDDLFWRSLVWAARKPFVIRGYPRFWSVRIDHNLDSNWYSRIREMYDPALTGDAAADGTGGPWKVTGSVNLTFMPAGDAGRGNVIADINAGKLQISPHAFSSSAFGDLFWAGFESPARPLTDSEWQSNVTSIQQFQQGNGGNDRIPFFSRWWVGHFYNLSNNIGFDLANTLGARYIGTTIKPGFSYTTATTQPGFQEERLQARPYWIHQLPPKPAAVFASDESYSFFFADDLTIGSRAGLPAQKFFLVGSRTLDPTVSEVPDMSWCNSQGEGAGFATARFEWYSWRLFSSMAPAEVYNQDEAFQQCALAPPPANTAFHNASEQIIHNVSTWLNAHGARHIFMQDLGQYTYARTKSKLVQASFDGSNVNYVFTGGAVDPDGNLVPTQVLVFDDDTEGRWDAIPGFANGLITGTPLSPGPPKVVAVRLVSVANVSSFTFTASGATQQLYLLATMSDGSSTDLSNAAGTTYSTVNPAAATVSATGLVKAMANGTAIITAVNGSFTATATVTVNIAPPDFALPGTLGSASITAGQSATYSAAIAPLNGFNQPITFTCSGAPAAATCSVSPSSVSPVGTSTKVQVEVTTTARASTLFVPQSTPAPPWSIILLVGLMTALLAFTLNGRRRLAMALPALALLIFSLGCGGGGSSTTVIPPQGGGLSGTPSGTYVLNITGTSGTQRHTTTATLVVK